MFYLDESIEERNRRIDPRYDYFCRTGRYPRKNWDPAEVPHENRPRLLDLLPHRANTVVGYATKWMHVANDGRPKIMVEPGAFSNWLESGADCPCITDHDLSHGELGRLSDHSLFLREDCEGLYFSVSLPDTELGTRVRATGLLGPFGASFDYVIREECMHDGVQLLRQLDLKEISVCLSTTGAIPGSVCYLTSPGGKLCRATHYKSSSGAVIG